jgi:hypothetical protein
MVEMTRKNVAEIGSNVDERMKVNRAAIVKMKADGRLVRKKDVKL